MIDFDNPKLEPFIGTLKSAGLNKDTVVGVCHFVETDDEMNRIVGTLRSVWGKISAEEAEQIVLKIIAESLKKRNAEEL